MQTLLSALDALVQVPQRWLFEGVVQPLLYAFGGMRWAEELFDFTEWVVLGAIEVVVLALVLGALERRWPAEPVTDRAAIRTDVLYTLLHRLGAFALIVFALVTPLVDALEGQLRLLGFSRINVDQLWPGVTDVPWVSFAIYLVLFDFVDYWLHRWQHRFGPWWSLHAVHHSQRQMTFWSDQRNHLLDDLVRDVAMAVVAVALGASPGQFVALVVASRVLQSLQHANLRLRWPGPLEALLVSPSFHRLHHAIGHGHEGPAKGVNFAVLFPVWDVLFGTADWRPGFVPTGIRDQLEGRDYGRGFWAQQGRAIGRWFGRA
ncbi:MAG TPA: sterol desaturase family protein [Burkholderiaceae bacterium]|nr:sterol desaturase family protein [Burkholderiaceae bacterium]